VDLKPAVTKQHGTPHLTKAEKHFFINGNNGIMLYMALHPKRP
jgi:hypothetical protein